jgi:hypothetical protein
MQQEYKDFLLHAENDRFIQGKLNEPINKAVIISHVRERTDKLKTPIIIYLIMGVIPLCTSLFAVYVGLNSIKRMVELINSGFTFDSIMQLLIGFSMTIGALLFSINYFNKTKQDYTFTRSPATVENVYQGMIERKEIIFGYINRQVLHEKLEIYFEYEHNNNKYIDGIFITDAVDKKLKKGKVVLLLYMYGAVIL